MSSSNDERRSSVPVRTLYGVYQNTIEARREYQQAVGGPMEQWALQNLHDAVLDYYEVLRPALSSMNATEELWEEAELWPTEPIMIELAYCPACQGHHPVEQLDDVPIEIGEPCPACGEADVDTTKVPETDEEGVVVYEWVRGLKSIDELRNQREVVEHTYQDALGEHTSTEVTTSLLAPEQLTAIARRLDEAMRELKLLATTDDKLPKGQINNDFDP